MEKGTVTVSELLTFNGLGYDVWMTGGLFSLVVKLIISEAEEEYTLLYEYE